MAGLNTSEGTQTMRHSPGYKRPFKTTSPGPRNRHGRRKLMKLTPFAQRRTEMLRKLKLSYALMLLMASAGCQSVSSSPYVPPKTPKPPAWTMERHEPNLTDRMLKILSE